MNVRNWWEVNPPDLPNPCNNPAGCVPRLYGIDITDDDVIYMSDAWNRAPTATPKTGTFLSTFGAGQLGGDNRGVVVNEALDRVYVVDAENSADRRRSTQAGAYIGSFSERGQRRPGSSRAAAAASTSTTTGTSGSPTSAASRPRSSRPTGTPLLRAPDPARKPPLGLLGQPRDVAVDDQTGEVWVADAWNQRFLRFSATGAHMGPGAAAAPAVRST